MGWLGVIGGAMHDGDEVTTFGRLDQIGLKAGSYLDRIIQRPLTLGLGRVLVGLNILIAIALIVLALNHLMALRWISDWDYLWHLLEFGLLIAMLVMMMAALPGKSASSQNLRNFTVLFLTYSSLNLLQNLYSAVSRIEDPATFLILAVIVTPLNLVLGTIAFLPTLFVWTRSLRGQPAVT